MFSIKRLNIKHTHFLRRHLPLFGFTLVELMVSLAITSILMLGMAAFFSSTFKNMFIQGEKIASTQGQLLANTILSGKFLNMKGLKELGQNGDYAVIQNKPDHGDKPFTFIGTDGASPPHLVSKDFFIFNGRHGSTTSQAFVDIQNPGGVAKLKSNYYVAAPLENKIYVCSGTGKGECSELGLDTDLNQPMDITSDGVTDTIYVTDAGNGRILKIDNVGSPTVSTLISSLNYPTGIVFYAHAGKNYLFVSETYNHVVKRIKLSDQTSEVVVGNGDDSSCDPSDGHDHTALYCKLNDPTGLVIGNDGTGDALYIADTGNGRVLKVTDPVTDLSNVDLPLSLSGSGQIAHIDFTLPAGTNITSVAQGSGGSDLHPSKLSFLGAVITASLKGQTTASNIIHQTCPAPPAACTDYFWGFRVDNENNIFQSGDTLIIDADPSYVVTGVTEDGANWKVSVTPLNKTIDPPVPSDIPITNNFSGNHHFFLNLSNVTFSVAGGFEPILIQAYDPAGALVNSLTDKKILRIGNGELGTGEDTISVVSSNLAYPTGLGWQLSFGGGGLLQVSETPVYSTKFPSFDYTSDFEIQNLSFLKLNANKLLELSFEAKIGEDISHNPIWETTTLDANLTP